MADRNPLLSGSNGDTSPVEMTNAEALRRQARSKEDRLVKDLRQHMQDKMTTDVFGIFAAVLRKRVGALDARHGEQSQWDAVMLNKDIQIAFFSFFGLMMSIIMTTMFWYFGNKSETSLGDTQHKINAHCSTSPNWGSPHRRPSPWCSSRNGTR